ncbi:porin [Bremerella sp.]|uniref:porin n=1 Tax=Bremerella sp. TaxID=2795602 RepID=UPI00391B0C92
MKMDWKAAMLAAAMMVGGSTVASAQEAGIYDASQVSYNAIASDCGCATDVACGDTALTCGSDCGCYSDCCCGGMDWFGCCDHGDPWTLFGENCCGVTIGGWISGGYYGNFRGVNTNNGNAPVAFRQISNAATLNQAWIYAEKAADAETYCFDLGYRVDAVFGADGPDTQAFGYGDRYRWDNGWNSATTNAGEALYGSAIPQAYLTAAWGDWEVKVGHFYTIIGYEVVQAPQNFFASYAYTMNYGEPFTHGGVLATYSGIQDTTLWGGYVQGWDTAFDNWEGQATFLGGISRDLSDSTTVTWAVNAGDWGKTRSNGMVNNNGNIYMNSFVLTHDLGCGYSYVFQHDLGVQTNIPGEAAYWYGVNQYFFKEINDCWSAGIRAEWFCDEDGTRVGNGPGSYYATTVGLNWKPNANVIVRPEIRFEKFDDIYNGGGTPYAEGTHDDCVFYGFDAILTF